MNEAKELNAKEIFITLILFFTLSVISIVLVYSTFEEGIEDFWEENREVKAHLESNAIFDLIDLDNVKTSGGVYDFDKESLANRYVQSGGKLDLMWELFNESVGE